MGKMFVNLVGHHRGSKVGLVEAKSAKQRQQLSSVKLKSRDAVFECVVGLLVEYTSNLDYNAQAVVSLFDRIK